MATYQQNDTINGHDVGWKGVTIGENTRTTGFQAG